MKDVLTMERDHLYYLGQPYYHDNPIIVHRRYELGLMATIELMNEGWHIYSPILHNHNVILNGGPQSSVEAWKKEKCLWYEYDLNVLERCDGLIVLKLEGWEGSVGLATEIAKTRELRGNIFYRDPPDVSKFS